jgi:hypothetical protein
MRSRPFETRSLPAVARCFLRSFTFYLALPKRSIRPAGLPIYVARVPAAPLYLGSSRCARPLPSRRSRPCRSSRSLHSRRYPPRLCLLCLARRSLGEGGSLSPKAPLKLVRFPVRSSLPLRLFLLRLARRSLGEGGSLIPSAPFTHSYTRQLEPSPARTLLCRSLRWHRCQGEAGRRELRSMGHNYGRDNARKRAKRRKKHKRLASAKKKQPRK